MDFQELSKLVAKKRKLIAKHQADITKLFMSCTHEYINMEDYCGGGFDYTSTTTTWKQCTLCKHVIDKKVKHGNHYS